MKNVLLLDTSVGSQNKGDDIIMECTRSELEFILADNFEYTLPNGAVAQILDIFDYISNNVLMPFLAICTCIMIGWVVKPRLLIGEIRMNGYEFHRKKLYIVMLRYVVPALLTILLISSTGIF